MLVFSYCKSFTDFNDNISLKPIKYFFLLGFVLSSTLSFSQSIVLTEVSQGDGGSREYVEFLVVGDNLVDCEDQPQCLDLRGWIFDDNNGYLNGSSASGVGIAPGCCRFAFDSYWECVPVGTTILIYNSTDRFPGLTDDTDMSDFSVVIPINSNLFDNHTTLPSTSSMAYPTSGWNSTGSWSRLSMANGGDGFQIYNPANASSPVFSVGWDMNDQGDIYFSNSSLSGDVMYVIDCDYYNQASWVVGDAVGDATPGSPNTAALESCITDMNANGTPPTVSLSVTDESCAGESDGAVTATVSGGTGSYVISWSPAPANGQGMDAISGLSADSYTVSIVDNNGNGCTLEGVAVVSSTAPITPAFDPVTPVCSGELNFPLPTTSTNGVVGTWSPSFDNTQTTDYIFTPTDGSCSTTGNAEIVVQNCCLANPGSWD